MNDQTTEPKPPCPQCGVPMDNPVTVRIVYRKWDKGKKSVVTEPFRFCSQECGSYYQMGQEG